MESQTLTELAVMYGCDKLHSHSYIPVYQELFREHRVRRLLEIGIGFRDLMEPFVPFYVRGASLKMWSDYLPDAEIFGCDIRDDVLINQGNIRSTQVDQSKAEDLARLLIFANGSWDVVIDDGSHNYDDQLFTAEFLLPTMSPGSLYIIEDTYPDKGAALAKHLGGYLLSFHKRPDDHMVVIKK